MAISSPADAVATASQAQAKSETPTQHLLRGRGLTRQRPIVNGTWGELTDIASAR